MQVHGVQECALQVHGMWECVHAVCVGVHACNCVGLQEYACRYGGVLYSSVGVCMQVWKSVCIQVGTQECVHTGV